MRDWLFFVAIQVAIPAAVIWRYERKQNRIDQRRRAEREQRRGGERP